MKKILYSFLAVTALFVSANMNAQEPNKDLLIGPGSNNWFLGIGGGVNALYDAKELSKPNNLAIAVNIGKWFTPAIGFRAGYVGLKDTAPMNVWFAGTNQFNYNLAHLDAMWNLAGTANYKLNRVWNPILYVRGGGVIANYQKVNKYGLAGGLGLINQFRLGNHASLAIDLSAITANGDNFVTKGRDKFTTFMTGTIGLVFDLGNRGFKRPATPKVDTRAIDELRNQLRAANARVDEANRSAAAANAVLRNLGYVSMLGPAIDSGLVCTLTAIPILMARRYEVSGVQGLAVALNSFDSLIPVVGKYLLMVLVVVFAFSTMFSYSYYGRTCAEYLFGKQKAEYYIYFYLAMILVASVLSLNVVVSLMDLAFALMSVPTMFAVLKLSPQVVRAMKEDRS